MRGLGILFVLIGWLTALAGGALVAMTFDIYRYIGAIGQLDLMNDRMIGGGLGLGGLILAAAGHGIMGVAQIEQRLVRLVEAAGDTAHDPATMPWSPKVDRARRTPPTVG